MRFLRSGAFVLVLMATLAPAGAIAACRTPISKETATKMSAALLDALPKSLPGWKVHSRKSWTEEADGPKKPCRHSRASVTYERNNCTVFVSLFFNSKSSLKSQKFYKNRKNYRKKVNDEAVFYYLEGKIKKAAECFPPGR